MPTPTTYGRPNNSLFGQPNAAGGGTGFDITPEPRTGQGPYGLVPGPVEYPTTPYAEASRIYPGFDALTASVGDQLKSQIAGEFTPQEENALWDVANRFGVASGMPGAGLWSNKFMGNVVGARQERIQQGIQNYQSVLSELSKMGVDPELAAQIAAHNAQLAAAPDPKAAAEEMLRRYSEALNQLGRNGGGYGMPQGGSGGYGYPNPAGGTAPTASTGAGFPFNTANNIPPGPGSGTMPSATTTTDLYGLGAVPQGTAYDPYTDSSINAPWLSDWANMFVQPSAGGGGYIPPMGDQATGGDLYGLGNTPFGTVNNPYTDQSTYDPFAGSGSSWFDDGLGTETDPWETYFEEYGY